MRIDSYSLHAAQDLPRAFSSLGTVTSILLTRNKCPGYNRRTTPYLIIMVEMVLLELLDKKLSQIYTF